MRLLTLVCFFHFSGLNNGFTFFAAVPGQIQPVSFAPVFMRSLCSAVNPFHWGQSFKIQSWARAFSHSRRTLQFSSRNAMRLYHPQVLLSGVRSWGLGVGTLVIQVTPSAFSKAVMPAHAKQICEANLAKPDGRSEAGIQSRAHASIKRTDERDPEKPFEFELIYFGLGNLSKLEDSIKIHHLYELHASLPSCGQNLIWLYCRGSSTEDPSIKFNKWNIGK